jgi:hypothetical protein
MCFSFSFIPVPCSFQLQQPAYADVRDKLSQLVRRNAHESDDDGAGSTGPETPSDILSSLRRLSFPLTPTLAPDSPALQLLAKSPTAKSSSLPPSSTDPRQVRAHEVAGMVRYLLYGLPRDEAVARTERRRYVRQHKADD